MMSLTRQDIEILLESPSQRDYTVSAYTDLTVKDGFRDFVDRYRRNEAREAEEILANVEARKALDDNIAVIHRAIEDNDDTAAKGMAVFSSVARGFRHVIPLDFPVENQLVIHEDPFVLPLLEQWYGEPDYLIVLVNSHQAHLFEAHHGVPEPVEDKEREFQRDKSRFTFKKRYAQSWHERQHDTQEDRFLKEVAGLITDRWQSGRFTGLILLGQAPITASVRRLLPKDLQNAVVEEAAQAMTSDPDAVADDVARVIDRWHAERDRRVLAELEERWKRNHLVANGSTDVLDALQQGRATQVVIGSRRDQVGARCTNCDYRFGVPTPVCPYCKGRCRPINATQEILQMALRHRVPVHLFRRGLSTDPLGGAGSVAALLRAEANWAPNPATARASEGH